MNVRRISLQIALLFSVYFANAQGTVIDVEIQNDAPSDYQIDITLLQSSVQPTTGSLSYNISANNADIMQLEFDETDICIESIKITCPDDYEECTSSASLDVKCYDENYSEEYIAPYNDERCYIFYYYGLNNINYCEQLEYFFKIY